jgi:hypothetical protein
LQMLLTPTIHTNYVDRLDAKKIQTTWYNSAAVLS